MNKNQIDAIKSRKIFFIGSARGVNRFYITNMFIEKFPDAKVISTGVLIDSLCKELGFDGLDKLTITEHYKFIEPIFIKTILSHLEHADVILDTHFHWLIPCISVRGLKKIAEAISKVVLVLVEEDAKVIYENKKERGDQWFNIINNIYDDLFFNRVFFDFYKYFFEKNSSQASITCDLKEESISDIIKFIKEFRPQIPQETI